MQMGFIFYHVRRLNCWEVLDLLVNPLVFNEGCVLKYVCQQQLLPHLHALYTSSIFCTLNSPFITLFKLEYIFIPVNMQ